MRPQAGLRPVVALLLLTGSWLGITAKVLAQEPPPPPMPVYSDSMEVLTRGPVHEAFAETVTFNPKPGIIVPKPPPELVEEMPPDQRPAGVNVQWIPGYWAWDADQKDFLWVSGVWRDVPPGHQWVPGYWTNTGQGYQWISGYWLSAKAHEIEYLPAPPATLEIGAPTERPTPDDMWFPGCWVWVSHRYVWRPGYWTAGRADWLWVPAHYMWSPRGHLFVDGYWDYPVPRRGVVFAPVRFAAGVVRTAGFAYSPATVIDLSVFDTHLFVRAHDYHYYFGDYYAPTYHDAGFVPAFSFHRKHGYEPIFAHERWEHRDDHEWEHEHEVAFQRFQEHAEIRPPRTFAAQVAVGHPEGNEHKPVVAIARTLAQAIQAKDSPVHFQALNRDEQRRSAQNAPALQRFREERRTIETGPAASGRKPTKEGTIKLKIPSSPITSPRPGLFQKRSTPPAPKMPKPDPKATPPHP